MYSGISARQVSKCPLCGDLSPQGLEILVGRGPEPARPSIIRYLGIWARRVSKCAAGAVGAAVYAPPLLGVLVFPKIQYLWIWARQVSNSFMWGPEPARFPKSDIWVSFSESYLEIFCMCMSIHKQNVYSDRARAHTNIFLLSLFWGSPHFTYGSFVQFAKIVAKIFVMILL